MNKIAYSLICLFLVIAPAHAQDVGVKKYPYLGIQFTIPQDWFGRETEVGYILGSNTEPGFILLITHEARTIEALKQEAGNGLIDDAGTMLQLSGELEELGDQGVGGTFDGTVEYQTARSYIAAVINPFGKGVMVMAVTDQKSYSKRYAELAQAVASSLQFAHPQESAVAQEWKETLKGAKLTYLKTTGGSDYSGYSGTSSRSEILLCSNQQFSYYSSNSSSFDINAGFGSANSSDNGKGKWQVATGDDGSALLALHFSDGREFEYQIHYREKKTYLGDTRYFRTYDHGECY